MKTIKFKIDHMDPMGQGVSREGKAVTFIAATLPGESGVAEIYKKSKGVQFARVRSVEEPAENRCKPQCVHFEQCPGCHYLHTDYSSELQYKRQALLRHLAFLELPAAGLELVAAPRRLHYRNRVQLHYRHKYIGMLDPVANKVVEIPHCQIFHEDLQEAFDRLYQDKSWTETHPGHGHCELYIKDGKVSQQWNGDYAHGGFSQVYAEMNLQLQGRVQTLLNECGSKTLADLFSGRGNLSHDFAMAGGERALVDSIWPDEAGPPADNFLKLDLYDDGALKRFGRSFAKRNFDTLLVDPPRRGFPQLNSWIEKIKPKYLIYVSCNAASLARDIRTLKQKYRVNSAQLLDLFPASYHYETLLCLRFRGT